MNIQSAIKAAGPDGSVGYGRTTPIPAADLFHHRLGAIALASDDWRPVPLPPPAVTFAEAYRAARLTSETPCLRRRSWSPGAMIQVTPGPVALDLDDLLADDWEAVPREPS